MSAEFEDKSFSESHLESPEYRKRLQRKLNTLIAVLEVACAKVRQSLAGPDPDVERLTRIHKNLKETLGVCQRAKRALLRCEKLPEGLPENLTQLTLSQGEIIESEPRSRHNVEMSSIEEAERFSSLSPIDPRDVRAVDLDELARQLTDEESEDDPA